MGVLNYDIDSVQESIVKMRRDLHKIPEVGTDLPLTKKYVLDRLKVFGISYEEIEGDSGVIAYVKGDKGNKIVALRADMDALPIVEETNFYFKSTNNNMHACGHDAHTATLLEIGNILNKNKDKIEGTVKLLFQTGEEIAKGAKNLVNANALNGVSAIVGAHIGTIATEVPNGLFVIQEGPLMASNDKFVIKIRGRGCHGAYPHTGINPIILSTFVIQKIQDIRNKIIATEPIVISVCKINSGTQYNIIPDEVIIEGTFRCFNEEVRQSIGENIKKAANMVATDGAVADAEIIWGCPPVINDKKVTDELKDIVDQKDLYQNKFTPSMGGEDFSEYQKKVPGTFIFFSTPTEKNVPHHNSKFEVDESKLYKVALLMGEWAIKTLRSK